MKKIISLILVVLLCLPAVFIPVSADGYVITAASGANTTSNDYININKYLAYYNGGDVLTIPENYITVGQWKANIANPAINANGVADNAYITSDCTLTLAMEDGVTTKTVEIDPVNYNESFKKYDKKQSTTFSSNDFGLTYSKGSKATVTIGNKIVSGSDYGLTTDVEVSSDATSMQGYVNIIQKLDTVKNLTTPYIIDMKLNLESTQSLYRLSVGFMNSSGSGRALTDLSNSVTNTFKNSETVDISMIVFPKAAVMDVYVNGSLVLANKTLDDTKNSTTYADYNRLMLRFYNGTKVNGVYENLTYTITDYEIRNGYGKVDSPIYVAPKFEITNYTDGAVVKAEDLLNVIATTNVDDYDTAELYINGSKVATQNITSKSVAFSSSLIKAGTNELEAIMYKNGKKPVSTGKITVTATSDVTLEGIEDGDFIHTDDFTGLVKASVNLEGYKDAELYINGAFVEKVSVSDKVAYLSTGDLEVGKYNLEVRMIPTKGNYVSKEISFEISNLTASEVFEFTYADSADKNSNAYKNIYKYVAYMGEELNIPANYITVGQWKANVKNPEIVADGLSDDAYITTGCSLLWTAADGVTTKTVDVYTAELNYNFKKYNNKELIDVKSDSANDIRFLVNLGTNGTLTTDNKDLGNGTYAINVDLDNFTGTSNPWTQIRQNVDEINKNIHTPYMMETTVKFNDSQSVSSVDFGFIGNSSFDGKQRAPKTITALRDAVKTGEEVKIGVVIYPAAQLADVYVNGKVVAENHNLVQTNDAGTSTYEDYDSFFIRFYNTNKVDGELKKMNYDILSYQIKYGYGNISDEVYVAPEVEIVNYKNDSVLTTAEITELEAATNSDDFVKAVLYIDGVVVNVAEITDKKVVFDMSALGYGDHVVEVRMYPEIGEYISKDFAVSVADPVIGNVAVYDAENQVVGSAPITMSKPASDISSINFVNSSQAGINNPTVIANDALVEYYDEVRGNVIHTKAAEDTNTTKTGRRIEIDIAAGIDAVFKFDFMMADFYGEKKFVSARHYDGSTAGEYTLVELTESGDMKVNGNKLTTIETHTWYTLEAFVYANMGGSLTVNIYDETGALINSVSTVMEKLTDVDTLRTYFQYDGSKRGERYYDNISVSTVYGTGSIAKTNTDVNSITASLIGVDYVEEVVVTGYNGNLELLGYSYNADDGVLTITTAQPISTADAYMLYVYADGYAVPITKGLVVDGEYIVVKDAYFDSVKGKDYVVLDVANTKTESGKITVLVSTWNGEKLLSTKAKTISVECGEAQYSVEIEAGAEKVKVMPVSSLAKPILLSNKVYVK